MNTPNIDTLNTFDVNTLPNLDTVVLAALELFENANLPQMDLSSYKHLLIVGSGNAEAAGRIVFHGQDAVFASESNFEEKLSKIKSIDGVVLLSASGSKHAPIIAKKAKEMGKSVTLITNTANSPAHAELEEGVENNEYVFPKNRIRITHLPIWV